MKFKFSKNLDYQKEAIDAIVNIFDTGKNIVHVEKGFVLRNSAGAVIANDLEIDGDKIIKNVLAIQKANGIGLDSSLQRNDNLNDFSIEMETGTGKTYVYLRTIFELNQKYGLQKFIILVPSVAIREGVLKTIEQTKTHFRELYNIGFGSFAYDSGKLSQVREFVQSLDIQIMIMTVQSFAGNERLVMRQTPDRFHGEKPIDLIASTRPVVIMDEPQNMESDLSKEAIADLKPMFKLRYSATHKEIHNLVYRLTPVDAYKKGLVKKISVFGVQESDVGAFQFKVLNIETKKGEYPKAKVLMETKNAADGFELKEVIIKAGDDLERKSKNSKYANLEVQDVNAIHNRIELSDGNFYKLEAESENKEVIFRTQIHETIKSHFDKQEELGETIKVLSLFFIDKVHNYVASDGLIRTIFLEEFEKLKKNYSKFKNVDVNSVHKGYFANKKEKGQVIFQDTKGDSKLDKEAYDLIMKEKERLLSFSEPVSFIFSHSALKEGWDNPNIFQICTLRETHSLMKKRQEIGRGLRLAVDVNGDRVFDERVNILTVIANESYQGYVSRLQAEFIDAGYNETVDTTDAKEKRILVKTTKQYNSEEFKELWKRICKKTKFNLEVLTDKLLKESIEKINELDVRNPMVTIERGQIYFDNKNKIQMVRESNAVGFKIQHNVAVKNILKRISNDTSVTQKTIFDIISQVENIEILFKNPEEYIRSVILIIKNCLNNLLINEGLKYIPTGDIWELNLFEPFEALSSKSFPSTQSVFDRVLYDSEGERRFAQSLEHSPNVKVYTKLPRGFRIDTPLGDYIPDWAIVWQQNGKDKLYFVRESKFGYSNLEQELSLNELNKNECGKKHFAAIDVDFKVVEKEDLSDLISGHGIKY